MIVCVAETNLFRSCFCNRCRCELRHDYDGPTKRELELHKAHYPDRKQESDSSSDMLRCRPSLPHGRPRVKQQEASCVFTSLGRAGKQKRLRGHPPGSCLPRLLKGSFSYTNPQTKLKGTSSNKAKRISDKSEDPCARNHHPRSSKMTPQGNHRIHKAHHCAHPYTVQTK